MCTLNANREEHNILLSDCNQDVVRLQETQVKADTNIVFKHYTICHPSGDDRHGYMVVPLYL